MPEPPAPTLHVVSLPVLDTGIGRGAGFRDDEHLVEVAEAERAVLSPEARALAEEIDRRLDDAIINGTGGGDPKPASREPPMGGFSEDVRIPDRGCTHASDA